MRADREFKNLKEERKMKRFFPIMLIILSFFALTAWSSLDSASAYPNLGSDCAGCHPGDVAAPETPAAATKSIEINGQKLTVKMISGVEMIGLTDIAKAYGFFEVNWDNKNKTATFGQVSINMVKNNANAGELTVKVKTSITNSKSYVEAEAFKNFMTEVSSVPQAAAVPAAPVKPAQPAQKSSGPVKLPSINDQTKNSPLGSRHWNMFINTYYNPEDPEQTHCIACHSAVAIVDDPNAKLTDFLKAGQEYCSEELEDVAPGQSPFVYSMATEDGKYIDNNFEGITCRVCHVMDKEGLTLRRPDNTCTLCHGRVFNWERGSGKHIEQDFFEGHGETYYDPSVHYTLGMQCQDCHSMNSIKHDYEPAAAGDIVTDAKCLPCHRSAEELENMMETTQSKITAALRQIAKRIEEAGPVSDETAAALISKAKARMAFVEGDFSEGVHNPQFAAKLINEAYGYLDEFDKLQGKSTKTAPLDLGSLSVYSQTQTSHLGSAHWDMLENTIFNPEDPDQDNCIKCHSAVAIVDDPNAKVADFLKTGQQYCSQELEDVPEGQSPFVYSTAIEDGKYLKNRLEGITCRVCHTFESSGNIALRRDDEQTCGLCHGRAFNWETGSAHHVELAFFKGQGSAEKGIPDLPSPKVAMGYACQDCHFMDSTKHDFEAASPAQIAANDKCSSCHTAANIEKMINEIQEEVTTTIAKLEPRLNAAKAYVDTNPANAEAEELYIQAKAGIAFVEDDFSEGVHNPGFAKALLERSEKLLTDFEGKY